MNIAITKRRVIGTSAILLLLYLSKPDKGGAWACSKTFGMPGLKDIQLRHQPFWHWELFESAKYRFHISPAEFSKLKSLLDAKGWSEWERMGLTYDSVDIGWEPDEDFMVTRKRSNGMVYYWSYSRNLNVVYAISWDD